jgi:hypothetical protein
MRSIFLVVSKLSTCLYFQAFVRQVCVFWAAKNSAASMRIGVGGIDGFCSDVGFGRRGATVWSRRMESWQW